MKKVLYVLAVIELAVVGILWHNELTGFLSIHPWIRAFIAALPALTGLGLTYIQWRDSQKITDLAAANNTLHQQANDLQEEANNQRERANEAFSQIARNTQRQITRAEANEQLLTKYIGKKARMINRDNSAWAEVQELIEIDHQILRTFNPVTTRSSSAFSYQIHCEDLEVVEQPQGDTAILIKVIKPYGIPQNLGQSESWAERTTPHVIPAFAKGQLAFRAEYTKGGTAERPVLRIFQAADNSNSFLLENDAGLDLRGDNVTISRFFLLEQLNLQETGFTHGGGSTGASAYPLYIVTRN